MGYSEDTIKMVNQKSVAKNRQITVMTNYLIENGYEEEKAKKHAHQLYSNGITFSDLLVAQGDLVKFVNDSVRPYDEEEKEVPIKGNIRSVNVDKEKANKKFKAIIRRVLVGTVVSGMVVVGLNTFISRDSNIHKHYDELSAKAAYLNEETVDKLQDANIVVKNKYIQGGEVYVNYSGIVEDLGEITIENPELLDTQLFKIYENIADIGTLENHESDEVIRSNQLEDMDIILETMKNTFPEGKALDKVSSSKSFIDYVYKLCADRNLDISPEIYNSVSDYNELKEKDVRGYPYSRLQDQKSLDKLLNMYSDSMDLEVVEKVSDLETTYEYMSKKGR